MLKVSFRLNQVFKNARLSTEVKHTTAIPQHGKTGMTSRTTFVRLGLVFQLKVELVSIQRMLTSTSIILTRTCTEMQT
jgi:hypothetical protein